MLVRVSEVPIVLEDDDGIRPDGNQNECFYCRSNVGNRHRKDCVTLLKMTRYKVMYEDRVVGEFVTSDPWSWSNYDCEFHKNDSSWCADNALDLIDWSDHSVEKIIETISEDPNRCTCPILSFRVLRIEDEGPFITRPDQSGGD